MRVKDTPGQIGGQIEQMYITEHNVDNVWLFLLVCAIEKNDKNLPFAWLRPKSVWVLRPRGALPRGTLIWGKGELHRPLLTLGQSRDWAALFRRLTQPCSGRSLPPLCHGAPEKQKNLKRQKKISRGGGILRPFTEKKLKLKLLQII